MAIAGYDFPPMAKIDPEKETQRLAQLYAGMEEAELEEIAGEADSLSEFAYTALNAELLRRGMTPLPEQKLPTKVAEYEETSAKPVMIRRYRDLPEASIAKSVLDSAGIESFLVDDNLVRLDWFYSNLVGGIKLFVRAEDVEAATKLLDQAIPEKFEVGNQEEFEQPRCPKCQSFEVSFNGMDKSASYATMAFGIPIIIKRKGWNCRSCGHSWQESDTTQSAQEKKS